MNIVIENALTSGKFLLLEKNRYDCPTLSDKPLIVDFDSSVCRTIPTWKEGDCRIDVKGRIEHHIFLDGYVPELEISGTKFTYHHDSVDGSPPQLMFTISDSEDLFDAYEWWRQHKNDKPAEKENRFVFKYDDRYRQWVNSGTYRDTSIESVVGLEDTYRALLADIQLLTDRREMIEKLGMSPSVNALLISKPGMGKTSLIRALATTLNVHIHTISSDALVASSPDKIFSTYARHDGRLIMYVFEDFDRYLSSMGTKQMASLLNAIDGVENMPMSLRIFTSNSTIEGTELEAFLSRMRRTITIGMHPRAAYERSIRIVFPEKAENELYVRELCDFFLRNGLTMRQTNNLLCASVVYPDPLEYILSRNVSGLSVLSAVRPEQMEDDDDD